MAWLNVTGSKTPEAAVRICVKETLPAGCELRNVLKSGGE